MPHAQDMFRDWEIREDRENHRSAKSLRIHQVTVKKAKSQKKEENNTDVQPSYFGDAVYFAFILGLFVFIICNAWHSNPEHPTMLISCILIFPTFYSLVTSVGNGIWHHYKMPKEQHPLFQNIMVIIFIITSVMICILVFKTLPSFIETLLHSELLR